MSEPTREGASALPQNPHDQVSEPRPPIEPTVRSGATKRPEWPESFPTVSDAFTMADPLARVTLSVRIRTDTLRELERKSKESGIRKSVWIQMLLDQHLAGSEIVFDVRARVLAFRQGGTP